MMKKLLSVLLCAALLTAFTGCRFSLFGEEETTEPPTTAAPDKPSAAMASSWSFAISLVVMCRGSSRRRLNTYTVKSLASLR